MPLIPAPFRVSLACTLLVSGACAGTPLPAQPGASERAQSRVIRAFYRSALADEASGLPSPARIRALAPFLSSGLLELLNRAREAERKFQAGATGPTPGLYSGHPFVSPGEGAQQLTRMRLDPTFGANTYRVELCSISRKDARPYDPMAVRVLLREERGRWVIDDIHHYQDARDPAPFGLRRYLESGIRDLAPAQPVP